MSATDAFAREHVAAFNAAVAPGSFDGFTGRLVGIRGRDSGVMRISRERDLISRMTVAFG